MDDMDILLTLYSIVAGLGISKLVQGLGIMIEGRERIRRYWVHSAWLFIVLAAHVVTIFALIRFAKSPHWTVFNSMLTLCIPVLLYLVSDLIVPTIGDDEQVDMRAYFYRNRKWFYGLLMAVSLAGGAVQIALEHTTDPYGGSLRLVAFLALGGGLASERPAVQSVVVVVLLAVMVTGATLVSVKLM